MGWLLGRHEVVDHSLYQLPDGVRFHIAAELME